MKKIAFWSLGFLFYVHCLFAQQQPVEYVNPFIGTSNYGATNPGAIAPRGMASVSPFIVAVNKTSLKRTVNGYQILTYMKMNSSLDLAM